MSNSRDSSNGEYICAVVFGETKGNAVLKWYSLFVRDGKSVFFSYSGFRRKERELTCELVSSDGLFDDRSAVPSTCESPSTYVSSKAFLLRYSIFLFLP